MAQIPVPEDCPANLGEMATQKDVIDLSRINLIGLWGTDTEMRALVRLPSGEILRLSVGDALDGGIVTAIGAQGLALRRGRRDLMITLSQG